MTAPFILTRDEAAAFNRHVLGLSKAPQAMVWNDRAVSQYARFARNNITMLAEDLARATTIDVNFPVGFGSGTTTRADERSLGRMVARADELAQKGTESRILAPEQGPLRFAEPNLWSETTVRALESSAAAGVVADTIDFMTAAGVVGAGYLRCEQRGQAAMNKSGLFAYSRATSCEFTVTARTADATGSGWAGLKHEDWSKIDCKAIAQRAIDVARRSANPVAVEPGRYTVILEPAAVAPLMYWFMDALAVGGGAFQDEQGKSYLGRRVVDSRLTFSSDPADPEAPFTPFVEQQPHFIRNGGSVGLPIRAATWIENGILKNLTYSQEQAAQMGATEPLLNDGALRMRGGTTSLDEMIASTRRGLHVYRLWGTGLSDVSSLLCEGWTRDGVFLIEDGKVTKPVKNFRFRESPLFVLNSLDAVGREERVWTAGQPMIVPRLKVRDFNMASMTDAV